MLRKHKKRHPDAESSVTQTEAERKRTGMVMETGLIPGGKSWLLKSRSHVYPPLFSHADQSQEDRPQQQPATRRLNN